MCWRKTVYTLSML